MAFAKRYPGGTEVEISMLFVDVRGSSHLAEEMTATGFAELMNRFYETATDVLMRTDAIIDKLVGDEVMALYVPLFTGPNHARPAVQAARELLRATGHGEKQGPWLPIGVGVHSGVAYVGTVKGAEGSVDDFTALGDSVNIAARLASLAAPGEALISETACARSGVDLGEADQRKLELKGKSAPVVVRALRVSTG